jgi:hypothetical protein
MAADTNPVESRRKLEALGRSLVVGEPLALGGGTLESTARTFGRFTGLSYVAVALAPPTLHIQRFEGDDLARVDAPIAISAGEIAKSSMSDFGIATSFVLKLTDGRKLRLGIVNEKIYSDDAPVELLETAKTSAATIVAWLKEPS